MSVRVHNLTTDFIIINDEVQGFELAISASGYSANVEDVWKLGRSQNLVYLLSFGQVELDLTAATLEDMSQLGALSQLGAYNTGEASSIFVSAVAPTVTPGIALTGLLWMDTTVPMLKFWNGAAWISVV